ncbi:hypothetical protein SAMN04487764_2133 [Gillisia sp. Hel1_33_143]|nr:hypothetical protein SAMN04487764_2133 [Gillisia sp. Hel1_33_143]
MNYLAIELSGRSMMLLGGIMILTIIVLAIYLANRYSKKI